MAAATSHPSPRSPASTTTCLRLFALLCFCHLVQGTSSNSTTDSATASGSCPPPGEGTTRSVWSILGSCGLTLLICVWHALHPDVPEPGQGWHEVFWKRVGFVLGSFFAPELVVGRAGEEWCEAHRKVREFRNKGYEWSMAHSHFAQMGGFRYRDEKDDLKEIKGGKFLQLCQEGKIADPLLTEREIKDRSKSDAIGKAIFTLQLFWFGLQVVVRGSKGLAVTLVELDTVCMATLALLYLFFWWEKPLRPDCPHVFCYTGETKVQAPAKLSNTWMSTPSYCHMLIAHYILRRETQSNTDREEASLVGIEARLSKPGKLATIIENTDSKDVYSVSLLFSWLLLGSLHLVAWNFDFPTETEKLLWRIASLVLACSSPTMLVVVFVSFIAQDLLWEGVGENVELCLYMLGIVSRALLVGLMLASLRALPCSAHDTVPWTTYVPHL